MADEARSALSISLSFLLMPWFVNDIICFCCAKARRIMAAILTISEDCILWSSNSSTESILIFRCNGIFLYGGRSTLSIPLSYLLMSWFVNDIICFFCSKARRVMGSILTISEACIPLLLDSTAESILLFAAVEDSCMEGGGWSALSISLLFLLLSWFVNDIICFCCAKARQVMGAILTISYSCISLLLDSTAESILFFRYNGRFLYRRKGIQHYL